MNTSNPKTNTYLSKKAALFVFIGTLFWLIFILRFGSFHLTLEKGWADSVSHLYTSWIVWDHGLDVLKYPTKEFTHPLAEEEKQALSQATGLPKDDFHAYEDSTGAHKAVFLVWPDVPRPYPPGLYIYMALPSVLLHQGILSLRAALALVVGFGILIAHIATLVFWRRLKATVDTTTFRSKLIPTLLGVFAYFESLRWTLNAQYDMIAVLLASLAVIAYLEKHRLQSICLLSIAVFLHLRVIYLLPLGLFASYEWIRSHASLSLPKLRSTQLSPLIVSLICVSLAVLTLVWNEPYFKISALYDLNSLHWSKLGSGNWAETLWLVLGLASLFIYWAKERQWLLLISASWITFMLLQTRLMREWYVLFLFPVILISTGRTAKSQKPLFAALLFYILFASLFMKNSPFEFRFIRDTTKVVMTGLFSP